MEHAALQHLFINILVATFSEERPTTAALTRRAHTLRRTWTTTAPVASCRKRRQQRRDARCLHGRLLRRKARQSRPAERNIQDGTVLDVHGRQRAPPAEPPDVHRVRDKATLVPHLHCHHHTVRSKALGHVGGVKQLGVLLHRHHILPHCLLLRAHLCEDTHAPDQGEVERRRLLAQRNVERSCRPLHMVSEAHNRRSSRPPVVGPAGARTRHGQPHTCVKKGCRCAGGWLSAVSGNMSATITNHNHGRVTRAKRAWLRQVTQIAVLAQRVFGHATK